jgi:outer membrane protein OmpA-like peptidoglycan-associated protein
MKRPMITLAGLSVAALTLVPAFAQVLPPPPTTPARIPFTKACDDVTMSVYFSAYETMLSSYSMRAVNAASDELAGCAVTKIRTEVVSEEVHSDEDLTNISEARAAAVLDAFNARGIRARDVRTNIAPTVMTTAQDGQKANLARRVDVVLLAEPGYGL